jgi:hypothetical protein
MIREIRAGRQAGSAIVIHSKDHLRNSCLVLEVKAWCKLEMKPGEQKISTFLHSKEDLRIPFLMLEVKLGV